ncbi:4Fe-4S dicluster domain-containing protein, partial [Clostridium algoriphilum]|uniref:4Fe-4S dicluster domain-containing protein n=1 Tax=Clostridium algoriphilum TaxID=198347 RepID=UPI001CF17357
MSIKIDPQKCVGCGKCLQTCPGNLIFKKDDSKAFIKYPEECWGCTACLKECPVQ